MLGGNAVRFYGLDAEKRVSVGGKLRFFGDGYQIAKRLGAELEVITPAVRRAAPDALSPNAKTHNYLNLVVADLQARAHKSDGWPILLDHRGFLCEGNGSNIFLVRDGELLTPKENYVLPGVSRQKAIDFAREHGVAVEEGDIDLYDAYAAEEAFITGTHHEIRPVTALDSVAIASGEPGPMTRRLQQAYIDLAEGRDDSRPDWKIEL